MFEIKAKDNMGRVGVLKTKHGDVKTPALMPVIHPRKQAIDVGKYGADIVITNAYLIYKDEELKKEAVEKGLHELNHFDGPIMTDSGSFPPKDSPRWTGPFQHTSTDCPWESAPRWHNPHIRGRSAPYIRTTIQSYP